MSPMADDLFMVIAARKPSLNENHLRRVPTRLDATSTHHHSISDALLRKPVTDGALRPSVRLV